MAERILIRNIEYPIAEHCNLTCAHCDHASPLLPARLADVGRFQHDLEALARVVSVEELRIIGGEPLLHPEILQLLAIAKASGLARELTVVTNGTLLHKAPEALWTLIDRLWISVYPRAPLKMDRDELCRRCIEHDVKLDLRDINNFRQTLVNRKIQEPAVVQQIYDRCAIAHWWRCYTIHDGRFYKCAPAPFMGPRLRRHGTEFSNLDDGVPIHDNPAFGEQLQAYLSSDRPLAACAFCLGTAGRDEPHRLLNKQGILDTLARDEGPIERLIDVDRLFDDASAEFVRETPYRVVVEAER